MQIAEFRKKYPEYGDMNDDDLTKKLHGANYSDMPFEQFTEQFLGSTSSQPTIPTQESVLEQPPDNYEITSIKSEPLSADEISQQDLNIWGDEQIKAGNIAPVEPGLWDKTKQDFKENWPQYAGAAAGAAVGMATFGPDPTDLVTVPATKAKVAKFLAGVGGATLGGAGGKGHEQLYRMVGKNESMTLYDIYSEQAIAAVEEGVSQIVGEGLARGGQKILTGTAKKLLKPILRQDAVVASRELMKQGSHVTLAQATDSRILDILEAVSEGSFIGGGSLQKMHTRTQPKAAKGMVADLLTSFSEGVSHESPTEIGKFINETIAGNRGAFNAAGKAIYKHLDKLAGSQKLVDLRPLKKYAIAELKNKFGVASSQMGETLLKRLNNIPDFGTFSQARSLRTSFMKVTDSASQNADIAKGVSKQLTKMTHDAMDKGATLLNKKVKPFWDFARNFTKEGLETFNSDLVEKIISVNAKNQPAKVVNMLLENESPELIKIAKKAVGPGNWPTVKYGYLANILKDSTSQSAKQYGIPQGVALLKKLDNLGPEALKEMFTIAERKSLENMSKTLRLMQTPTQEYASTGRMLVALMQAGALTASAWKRDPGSTALILGGPYALGRIMSNPVWSKLLTDAIKHPTKSSVALGRLTTIARRYGTEYAKSQKVKNKNNKIKADYSQFKPGNKQ